MSQVVQFTASKCVLQLPMFPNEPIKTAHFLLCMAPNSLAVAPSIEETVFALS